MATAERLHRDPKAGTMLAGKRHMEALNIAPRRQEMTARQASAEDALSVYTLAVAYLYNAKISDLGLASASYVREVAPHTFCIWHREQNRAPLATCIYNEVAQTWKVALGSGETLTLHDQGDVWDFVKEEKRLLEAKIKNGARHRGVPGSVDKQGRSL